MATAKSTRLELDAARKVYATPTGFKASARGPVLPPATFYGLLNRGDARRLRKLAHRAGLVRHAAAQRDGLAAAVGSARPF